MPNFRTSDPNSNEHYNGNHRFEHWYRDNQVYFITARCRDRTPAFASEAAKVIFWDRFEHYAREFGFTPWVTSLVDNHYHTLGYLRVGEKLGPMVQRLHGSVAKLVNDLSSDRLKPFWYDRKHSDYMDGCIRDELQCRRAYRYVMTQSVRHGLVRDWQTYPHTRVAIGVDRGVARALQLGAFMTGVRYPRYGKGRERGQGH